MTVYGKLSFPYGSCLAVVWRLSATSHSDNHVPVLLGTPVTWVGFSPNPSHSKPSQPKPSQ